MIIGSHPHVLQPIEWRQEQDQLVAYSLGNFVSGQRDRYRNGGSMLQVDLKKIILSRGDAHVADIYEPDIVSVETHKSSEEVVEIMRKYDRSQLALSLHPPHHQW